MKRRKKEAAAAAAAAERARKVFIDLPSEKEGKKVKRKKRESFFFVPSPLFFFPSDLHQEKGGHAQSRGRLSTSISLSSSSLSAAALCAHATRGGAETITASTSPPPSRPKRTPRS